MRVCRDGRGAAGGLGGCCAVGGRDPAPRALSLVAAASFSCFVRPPVLARFSFTACGGRCSGSGGGAASAGGAGGAGAIGGGLGAGIGATMGMEGRGAMAAGAGGDGAFAVWDFESSKIARTGAATAAATTGVDFDMSRVRSVQRLINSLAVRDSVVGCGTDGLIGGAIAIGDARFSSTLDAVDIPSTGAAVPAAAARKAREKALIVGKRSPLPLASPLAITFSTSAGRPLTSDPSRGGS